MEYLFSYGTLQKQELQLELIGRIPSQSKDCLSGYQRAKIDIIDSKFLSRGEDSLQQTLIQTKEPGQRIEGTVLELSIGELETIDTYEPENYKRRKVVLDSGKKAWIYFAT